MRPASSRTVALALVLLAAAGCRAGRPLTSVDSYVAGGEFVEADMLACRPGYAAAGLRVETNQLLCRRVVPNADTARLRTAVDAAPATVRRDMHACPTGQYVRGVHVVENRLLCSWDGRVQSADRLGDESLVGGGTEEVVQEAGIEACPVRAGRVTVLTGVHATRRQYLCSSLRP